MPHPLAEKLRRDFPHLYLQKDDAAILEDFRNRGSQLTGGPIDPSKITDAARQGGIELSQPSALKTFGKSTLDSLSFGLGGRAYEGITGEDLYSPTELAQNSGSKLVGDLLGSVVGLGKLRWGLKGAQAGARMLGLGDKAQKAAAVMGALGSGGLLGERQQQNIDAETRATNASGVNEGNTTAGRALAFGGGALFGMPLAELHGLGLIRELGKVGKISEGVGSGVGGHILNSVGTGVSEGATAEDKFRIAKEQLTSTPNLLMSAGLTGLGTYANLKPWGPGGAQAATQAVPTQGATQAVPQTVPPPTAGVVTPSAAPGAPPALDPQAIMAAIRQVTGADPSVRARLDERSMAQRLAAIRNEAERPWGAQRDRGLGGFGVIDDGSGTPRKLPLLEPNAGFDGTYMFLDGQDPTPYPAAKITDLAYGLNRGTGSQIFGRWAGGRPGQFSPMDPHDLMVTNNGQNEYRGSIVGYRRSGQGDLELGVARPNKPWDFYKYNAEQQQMVDWDDPDVVAELAKVAQQRLAAFAKPLGTKPQGPLPPADISAVNRQQETEDIIGLIQTAQEKVISRQKPMTAQPGMPAAAPAAPPQLTAQEMQAKLAALRALMSQGGGTP